MLAKEPQFAIFNTNTFYSRCEKKTLSLWRKRFGVCCHVSFDDLWLSTPSKRSLWKVIQYSYTFSGAEAGFLKTINCHLKEWSIWTLDTIKVQMKLKNDDNLKLRVEFWGCRLNTWDVNFSCSVTTLAAGLSHSSAAVDFWCDAAAKSLKIDWYIFVTFQIFGLETRLLGWCLQRVKQ